MNYRDQKEISLKENCTLKSIDYIDNATISKSGKIKRKSKLFSFFLMFLIFVAGFIFGRISDDDHFEIDDLNLTRNFDVYKNEFGNDKYVRVVDKHNDFKYLPKNFGHHITAEAAIETVKIAIGSPNAKVTYIDKEYDDGTFVYDIELMDEYGDQYEFVVDAITSTILDMNVD